MVSDPMHSNRARYHPTHYVIGIEVRQAGPPLRSKRLEDEQRDHGEVYRRDSIDVVGLADLHRVDGCVDGSAGLAV